MLCASYVDVPEDIILRPYNICIDLFLTYGYNTVDKDSNTGYDFIHIKLEGQCGTASGLSMRILPIVNPSE